LPPRRPKIGNQQSADNPVPLQDTAVVRTYEDDVAKRILARVAMPVATLDESHLPAPLVDALKNAELGSAQHLGPSAITYLAMASALAGPNVTVTPIAHGKFSHARGLSIRVCHVVANRDMAVISPLLITAIHAVQNELIEDYRSSELLAEAKRREAAKHRSLHAQLSAALIESGKPPLSRLVENDRLCSSGSAPQLLVDQGAMSAVIKAADGGTGVMLIDERRMPSFPRCGAGD